MRLDKMLAPARLLLAAVSLFLLCCYGCAWWGAKGDQAGVLQKTASTEDADRKDPTQDQVVFRGQVMTAAERQAVLDREKAEAETEALRRQSEIARLMADGRAHLQESRWDAAIESFNNVLALDAAHMEARRLLAKAEQGREDEFKKAYTNDLGMTFVWIEPGGFQMGSPSKEQGRYGDEVQHPVILTRGFYLQTTEVTQGQWKKIMNDNPAFFKECGDNCPVEQVSWNDVRGFISRLNKKTGRIYRLPTEAEWEYACRAGTTGLFHTGDCLTDAQANYDSAISFYGCPRGKLRGKPVPVKSFPPNAWGLYDMHGNVWEWCADWYGDYPSGSVKDPAGPDSGASRVNRGGCWNRDAVYCRSAIRNDDAPDSRFNNLGFRLVLQP
ncbi:MAG: SUMF1/EgtB/PvdO family nonheme iron enzyme [Thermodesulfobacteriota bacterium]